MNAKRIFAAMLLVMLLALPISSAFAAQSDVVEDGSIYFKMEYIDPEDLGDESMPLYLLCGAAVLAAAGAAVIHKKRVEER